MLAYTHLYTRSHFGSSQLGARRTGNFLDLVADDPWRSWVCPHRPLGGDLSSGRALAFAGAPDATQAFLAKQT